MESHDGKQGRFPQIFEKYENALLKSYGLIQGNFVRIVIYFSFVIHLPFSRDFYIDMNKS